MMGAGGTWLACKGLAVNQQPVLSLTTTTRVVILTAFYFIGGILGKEGTFLSGNAVLVWPPSGIALTIPRSSLS